MARVEYRQFQRNFKGYCTPNLKLTCFVCYLKIIDTFSKINTYIFKEIVQGTQK